MKYYIKVVDGQVVEGPKAMPSGESASPNKHWKKEQLKLNGILVADVECGADEYPDFEGFTFDNDKLTIPIKPKSIEQVRKVVEEKFRGEFREKLAKFTLQDQMLVALGIQENEELTTYLQAVVTEFNSVKFNIKDAITIEELKGITATWPA